MDNTRLGGAHGESRRDTAGNLVHALDDGAAGRGGYFVLEGDGPPGRAVFGFPGLQPFLKRPTATAETMEFGCARGLADCSGNRRGIEIAPQIKVGRQADKDRGAGTGRSTTSRPSGCGEAAIDPKGRRPQ